MLAALWGVALLQRFEHRAGHVYRAAQTKAALAAFEDARLLYPRLPVVFSTYLARRLAPLLKARGCTACGSIVTHVDTPEELPARPFVALIAHENDDDTLGPVITKLKRRKRLRLEPIGHGSYQAPAGRRSELRAALYPFLGELAEPDWEVSGGRQAIRLYLVTDRPAPAAN